MKRLFYGLVLAVCGFMMPQAYANDFGCCPPSCGPCCYEPAFDGFYVGGNIGALHNLVSCNDYDAFFSSIGGIIAPAGFSAGGNAFTAGVQLGYDWQNCNMLLGVVGDWNWTHLKRNFPFATNVPGLIALENTNKNRWYSTIRFRTGVVICDTLVYVTGGGAALHHKSGWRRDIDNRRKDTIWGWTAGFGLEHKLGCNWSVGAEVLSLHFTERQRRVNFNIGGETAPLFRRFRLGFTDSVWVGRILVNYRFGDMLGCCN